MDLLVLLCQTGLMETKAGGWCLAEGFIDAALSKTSFLHMKQGTFLTTLVPRCCGESCNVG